MVTYDSEQQRAVRSVFERFEAEGCLYVIPRGHRNLPASVPGDDIEVLVAVEDFERATSAAEAGGFASGSDSGYAEVVRLALRNPTSTVETVLSQPGYVASVLLTGDVSQGVESSLRGQVMDETASASGVDLHLHNHLAYKSPMFDHRIRVDPAVERGMLSRRRREDGLFVSSQPDELVHLVCRGVFDYDGSFPEYYVERCEQLWDEVAHDEEWHRVFRTLCSEVFYGADELVYEHVADGEYATLREDLAAYSEY